MSRVTEAEEGDLGGATKRDEAWSLDQLGNWGHVARNLNVDADSDFTDAYEFDDERTHSIANELTGRDTDDNGTDDYTLEFDGNAPGPGNQTRDGKDYTYKYDGWNRLKEVRAISGGALVEEFKYNGLGYRTGVTSTVSAYPVCIPLLIAIRTICGR